MGLHLCVHVSVYGGIKWGTLRWGRSHGYKVLSENQTEDQKRPCVFLSFIVHSLKHFFKLYCIKYRVPFDLHVITAFLKCHF